MIAVDRLQVAGHAVRPMRQDPAACAGRSAWLVGELPTEDGRIVAIRQVRDAVDVRGEMQEPALVGLTNARIAIEICVGREAVPSEVLVHAAEFVPVVGQYQHELDAQSCGLGERVVESAEAVRSVIEDWALRRWVPALKPEAALRAVPVDVGHAAIE